jgi:hypothetical protein
MQRSSSLVFVFVLVALSPAAANAQDSDAPRHAWSLDGAAGLGWFDEPASLGHSFALGFGRTVSQRVGLRVATELSSWRGGQPECANVQWDPGDPGPSTICFGPPHHATASLTAGLDLAAHRLDAGPYLSARLGAYMLDSGEPFGAGGYVGVGLAVATSFGALVIESGIHGHTQDQGHDWVIPVRLGLRWRP